MNADKVLGPDPNSAWTLENKSLALNGLKKYEEALECSDKALGLDIAPYNHFALNNKYSGFNGLKKYKEALECSDKVFWSLNAQQ